MFVELWMVGVRKVPHSNQNTQASIESYHGVLKCWFALDTKGLRRHRLVDVAINNNHCTHWKYKKKVS
jgi:hypothetical protein